MLLSFNKYFIIEKNYNYIDNSVEWENEPLPFYYVPFKFPDDEIGLKDNENYFLSFPSENFVYDYIKDSDIEEVLKLDLSNIDISKDWTNVKDENDTIYTFTAYDNKNKHVLRIAKLVKEIQNNIPIKPVIMYFDERAYVHDIKNYIEDGNHRIRALQFLKYDTYPAYIGGHHAKQLIEYLLKNIKQ